MFTYLDHNATTPVDDGVLEGMLPYMRKHYGNPSSGHRMGRVAAAALDVAREQVAALVHVHPSQVIFTGGGTEANNLALKGVVNRLSPGLIALSAVEHDSMRMPANAFRRQDWQIEEIAVDENGQIDSASLQAVIARNPKLLVVMQANNETGVIIDTTSIAEAARQCGAIWLTDAVQAVGKIPVDFATTGAHLMSLSAHKIYGPKGVGALIVDKAVDIEPLLHGGQHEKKRRAGTENVAAIVGFGLAAERAFSELSSRRQYQQALQRYLEDRLSAEIPQIVIFGQQAERLPNTTFFSVPGLHGETLLMNLDQAGIAVSSGSACGTSEVGASHVLLAMGVEEKLARGAVRVSLGKDTQQDEIDYFVDCFKQQVKMLQSFGAVA